MAHISCATPGEQAYQQIVSQKLIGLHLPVPQTTAAVLRELLTELSAIQHDVQHFSHARMTEKSVVHSVVKHDSVHRIHSYTDHAHSSSSIHKQPSKKHKTPLEGLTEENTQPESELSALDRFVEGQRIEVLASVSSESVCSNELPEDIGIGLPSLSRPTRGTRSMMQTFRQSFLVRDPRKRIAAQEGSRLLTQKQNLKQTDPFLTASAESLLRESQPAARKSRNVSLAAGHRRDSKSHMDASSAKSRSSRPLEVGNEDIASVESFGSDEMGTSAGPAAAAAIATSLYGSGAPYLHAREKARQELAKLVGICPTEVELSTVRKDDITGLHDLVTVAQSTDTAEGTCWHPSHAGDRDGQAVLSQTHKPHQPERPVEERLKFAPRTSKINYV
ncbi:hypothetical protein P879_00468 [Paragonimus westermani]|uniref:Uncharacterized protein n=1 Tax=Paragonimus westermani TaxID=34504 RepID=A0A8T0DN71_9TREM|nr:hypothetical protein P879_00468 [Paragonimus westermani]